MGDREEIESKFAAWLLECAPGYQIAVGTQVVQEYLVATTNFDVPVAPRHCNQLILWREQLIPLFDLRQLHDQNPARTDAVANTFGIIVLAYQREPGLALEYLALNLYAEPEKIMVDDGDATTWPNDYPQALRGLVRALIARGDGVVSVVDLAALASARYLNYLITDGFIH